MAQRGAALDPYERFLTDRLLPDLARMQQREALADEEIARYEGLMAQIDGLLCKRAGSPPCLVDIGCGVFAEACLDCEEAPLLVNVGLDVFVEFPTAEALYFCHQALYHLRRRRDSLVDSAIEIQCHIDMLRMTAA